MASKDAKDERRVCATCRWAEIVEDQHDTHSPDMVGRRVYFDCGRSLAGAHSGKKGTLDDRRDVPNMLTVLERESRPYMKAENSFIHTFGCNHWEEPVDGE